MSILKKIFINNASWTAALIYLLTILVFSPYLTLYDNAFYSIALEWGEPVNYIISYLLMYPMSWFSSLNTPFDPYTLFILLINGISIFLIARYSIQGEKFSNFAQLIGWALIIVLLLGSPVLNIELPSCSFVGVAAGLLCLLHSVRHKSHISCVFAVLFILMAAALRVDGSIAFIPVIFVIAFYEWFRKNKKFALWGLIVIFGLLFMRGTQSHFSSSVSLWEKNDINLNTIHETRTLFADYRDYTSSEMQKKKESQYESLGFTEALKDSFASFHFNTPLREQMEWWEKLKEIRQSNDESLAQKIKRRLLVTKGLLYQCVMLYRYYFFTSVIISLLVFCAHIRQRGFNLFSRDAIKSAIPILIYQCIFAVLVVLLCFNGRIVQHAFFPIFFALHILMLDAFKSYFLPNKTTFIFGICLCTLSITLYKKINPEQLFLKSIYSPFKLVRYTHLSTTLLLEEEFKRNPQLYYFSFTQDYRATALPSNNLLTNSINRFPRYFPIGDWESLFPFYEKMLHSVGIKNDIELVTNKNARFIVFGQNNYNLDLFKAMLGQYNEYHRTHLKFVEERYQKDHFKIYRIE